MTRTRFGSTGSLTPAVLLLPDFWPTAQRVLFSTQGADLLRGTFGSGNGTFINGKRLTKSKKMLLHSGDQIGIVTDKERLLVEMGYTFQPIN